MRFLTFLPLLFVSSLWSQSPVTFYFITDADTLEVNERRKFEAFTGANPDIEVYRIDAFCDWRGSVAYNDDLAQRRALHLKQLLLKNGVAMPDSLSVHGIGERFEQDATLSLNRKVTLHYRWPAPKKPSVSALERQISEAVQGDIVRLPDLHFYNMSATMLPGSRPIVQELLHIMTNRPGLHIEIQGHICCQLNEDADLSRISEYRAKAVYDYLRRGGISADRMRFKGYGVSSPVYPIPEKNEEERNANRRVQVKIVSND